MKKKKSTIRALCPACRGFIELKRRYRLQEMISCPHCSEVLEIVKEYPQILDFPDDPYIPIRGRYPHRY